MCNANTSNGSWPANVAALYPTQKLIPIVADDELTALLATCAGKTFLVRRDTALIRLLMDTGARLAEITLLNVDDLDLKRDLVLVHGKGDKQRRSRSARRPARP